MVAVNHQRLNSGQLEQAVAAANRHFSLIRQKYPHLRAHLVISLLGDQTAINSSLERMTAEYPALIANGHAKNLMLGFLNEPLPEKSTEAQKKTWKVRFHRLANDLEFDGNAQVAIVFHELDYDLIWKLQADELVDRQLTPQTKAFIRIVLGTVDHFARLSSTEGAV